MPRTDSIDVVVRMRGARTFQAQAARSAAALEAMGVKGARGLTSLASASQRMTTVGRKMTTGFSLPVAAIGGYAIKSSIDFNRSMELISTQAGGTQKEVDSLTKSVLDLSASGKVEQGPQELSEALFHIESAGLRGAKALDTLKASADLAATGQSEMEGTTNALVAATKTGIRGAGNLRQAIGTLNATVGAGNMRMDDLVGAMGTGFLSSARQVGLSLTDVGTALASLTKQGIPAQAAATRLRMTFTLMAAPTDKAKEALKGIGLSASDLAETMRTKGLVPAIAMLKEHLDGLSKVKQTQLLAGAFGGARSGTTIMSMVNNLDDLGKTYKDIGKNAGNFNEKLEETRQTAGFRAKAALAQLNTALVRLGDVLAPVVLPAATDLAHKLGTLVGWFSKLPDPIKNTAAELLLVGVVTWPLIWMVGGLTKGYVLLWMGIAKLLPFLGQLRLAVMMLAINFAALDLAVLLIPAAIILIGAALVLAYMKVKWFRDAVDAVFNWIKDHWRLLVVILTGPFGAAALFVADHFGDIKDTVSGVFGWLKGAVGDVGRVFRSVFGGIRDFVTGAFDKVKGVLMDVIGFIEDRINDLINAYNAIPLLHDIDNPFDQAAVIQAPPHLRGSIGQLAPHLHGPAGQHGFRDFPGGWAIVGEAGPEIAQLPKGTNLFSNIESKQMAAAMGGASQIVIPVYLDGKKITEVVANQVEKARARQ